MRDKVQKRVREASEFWRRHLAEARDLVNELAQKEYPPDWWLKNWRHIDEQREQVRKRIIEEYGLDLQIPDWLEQLMVDARRRGASEESILTLRFELGPPLVVDLERLLEQAPRWDSQRFRAANWAYRMLNMLRWNMSEAILEIAPVEWKKLPPERVQEKVRALNLAVVNVLASVPYAIASMAGDIVRLSPVPKEAEAATFSLSGFVDAQISRDPGHRHNKALRSSEQLDFLSGSVREAWDERPPEEPIYRNPHKKGTNLVSRVETLLGKLGDEAAEKPENVSGLIDPQLDISPTAQFSAREAAKRELDTLKEKVALNPKTALTPLEDRVLGHKLAGYTHAEIGAQEGISEDKSQRAFAKARDKLKWAAGQ